MDDLPLTVRFARVGLKSDEVHIKGFNNKMISNGASLALMDRWCCIVWWRDGSLKSRLRWRHEAPWIHLFLQYAATSSMFTLPLKIPRPEQWSQCLHPFECIWSQPWYGFFRPGLPFSLPSQVSWICNAKKQAHVCASCFHRVGGDTSSLRLKMRLNKKWPSSNSRFQSSPTVISFLIFSQLLYHVSIHNWYHSGIFLQPAYAHYYPRHERGEN